MRRRALIAGGAAVAVAAAARAQQPRTRRLAILTQAEPVDPATGRRDRSWAAFFEEMRRLGYEEGANLAVSWHSSAGDAERAIAVARQMAALRPDAVFSPDTRMANLLRAEASSVPVVTVTLDPVGAGLADSLARPGGNVTGFTVDAGVELIAAKRMDLLKQAAPHARTLGWLAPRRLEGLPAEAAFRDAARTAGIAVVIGLVDSPADEPSYRRAFAVMAGGGVQAVQAASTLENLAFRALIADFALAARLPSMFGNRENVDAGGLMSYGSDAADTFRRAADYVARILRGANPAEMPFQQPSRFELVINLRTAKSLGLILPPLLLARADEVIE